MKVAIIGPGALGLFVGQALLARGAHVGYLGRRGPTAFKANFRTADGVERTLDLPLWAEDEFHTVEIVLVAVKAFDLSGVEPWLRLFPHTAPRILVMNGAILDTPRRWGESALGPPPPLRLGLCTFGIAQTENGVFEQRSATGEISLGAVVPEDGPRPADRALVQLVPELFHWRDDILDRYRRKWLFNTVINTLCAVHRLPRNGDLLGRSSEVLALFHEAFDLGRVLWGPWSGTSEVLLTQLWALIEKTSANENSMARDVRLGRPTETEYLGGMAEKAQGGSWPRLTALNRRLLGGT